MENRQDNENKVTMPSEMTPLQALADEMRQEYIKAKSETHGEFSQHASFHKISRMNRALEEMQNALEGLREKADDVDDTDMDSDKQISSTLLMNDYDDDEARHRPVNASAVMVNALQRTFEYSGTFLLWLSPLIAMKAIFNYLIVTNGAGYNPMAVFMLGGATALFTVFGCVGAFSRSLKETKETDPYVTRYPSLWEAGQKVSSYYGGYLLLAVLCYSLAVGIVAVLPVSMTGMNLMAKIAFTLPVAYILATYGQIFPSILMNRKASLHLSARQTQTSYKGLMKAIFSVQAVFMVLSGVCGWMASLSVSQANPMFQNMLSVLGGFISVISLIVTMNIIFGYYISSGNYLNRKYVKEMNI